MRRRWGYPPASQRTPKGSDQIGHSAQSTCRSRPAVKVAAVVDAQTDIAMPGGMIRRPSCSFSSSSRPASVTAPTEMMMSSRSGVPEWV
jgi:hypothetical protein